MESPLPPAGKLASACSSINGSVPFHSEVKKRNLTWVHWFSLQSCDTHDTASGWECHAAVKVMYARHSKSRGAYGTVVSTKIKLKYWSLALLRWWLGGGWLSPSGDASHLVLGDQVMAISFRVAERDLCLWYAGRHLLIVGRFWWLQRALPAHSYRLWFVLPSFQHWCRMEGGYGNVIQVCGVVCGAILIFEMNEWWCMACSVETWWSLQTRMLVLQWDNVALFIGNTRVRWPVYILRQRGLHNQEHHWTWSSDALPGVAQYEQIQTQRFMIQRDNDNGYEKWK